ncbi:hypothetical protein [Sinorhizobium meliloti]|uniref:hypothetical protein n=1 Tax=Rhizobium meliloti TaxID=382 RepID=UPI00000CB0C4|nr:hypothetical protein [Sinorhizobium meliloti]TWB25238.1 hypothetical protein FB001_14441 [Ensifer sp. SEMIA 135]MCK3803228.1 hypothetical protein [Sinorhizobium meliloti]MCK3810000.1 hypothetical protein [Sinorhizobium meliloti]MCK3816329.1 hypothetical protein [Sinorhizobium meliloti]MDE3812692.1 hypothetical protein [Sinorhizobium meliloti]
MVRKPAHVSSGHVKRRFSCVQRMVFRRRHNPKDVPLGNTHHIMLHKRYGLPNECNQKKGSASPLTANEQI